MTRGRLLVLALAAVVPGACASSDDGDAAPCEPLPCDPDAGTDAPVGTPDAGLPDADGRAADAMPWDVDGMPGSPDARMPDALMADAASPDAAPPDTCDPDPPIYPGADEVQDGLDNDCDGYVDELEVCNGAGGFTTIGAAIAAAGTTGVIQVCPGTYRERLHVDGKALLIVSTGSRDVTIIDAEGLGSAIRVTAAPAGGVRIAGFTIRNGDTMGNGGGVRCSASALELDDVVVEDHRAFEGGALFGQGCNLVVTGSVFWRSFANERGGAVSLRNTDAIVENSHFTNNEAGRHGGALAAAGGDVVIQDNIFARNTAGLQGGALHYRGNGRIERNEISENHSRWTGGGVYLDQGAPALRENQLLENSSVNDGGGIYLHQSDAVLERNEISLNHSGDDGGGVRLFECSARLEDNVVADNRADDSGAGIRVSHVPCAFINNTITGNEAQGAGGGIDLDNDSSVVRGGTIARNEAGIGGGIHAWIFPWNGGAIEDVLIEDNQAWRGGGIFLQHNFQPIALRGIVFRGNLAGYGAGIYIRTSRFTLSHSTFEGNHAWRDGAAIHVGGEGSEYDETPCPPCPPEHASGTIEFVVAHGNTTDRTASAFWLRSPDLTVHSSILSGHAGDAVVVDTSGSSSAPPDWTYNDTYPASFAGIADPTGSNGNLSSDPLFVDAANGDFHLQAASVCVDAGNPAFVDTDSSRADMGIYGGLGGTP